MDILDPIERGEARAERFAERIHGNIYTCSCGNQCSLDEVETLSPDPYAEPFCPNCLLARFESQANKRRNEMGLESILSEIKEERAYQDSKWGTDFDDKNTANDWIAYIVKYAGMAVTMPWDEKEFRTKTLKVAALAVAAIECLERNSGMPSRHYDD